MIKVILFDADGVLITGQKFSAHLQNDLHISPEMTAPFFTGPFKKCIKGESDLKIEIAPFLPQWGWEKSVDEFLDLWFKVEHHLNMELLETISELRKKGIKCYLATNQEKYRSQYMREFMELDKLLDGVFASNQIGACKPESEFYQYIIRALNVIPNEIMFFDDHEANVEGARMAGIDASLYNSRSSIALLNNLNLHRSENYSKYS